MRNLTYAALAIMSIADINIMLSSPALAADEVSYKFDLTPAEINIVAEGLGMLPYGKVAPLMAKLQQQINVQAKPEAKPKEEQK